MILRELPQFDIKGEIYLKKRTVTLIDDYGHHPTEIEATVKYDQLARKENCNDLSAS